MAAYNIINSGKPKFQHDCTDCTFVGTLISVEVLTRVPIETTHGDVYLCKNSVILRYSDEPVDNISIDVRCITPDQFMNLNSPIKNCLHTLWTMGKLTLHIAGEIKYG